MRYDDVLVELRTALEAGVVDEGDVRRLLARADRAQRPGPAGLLRAAGAIVFLLGLGLLFGLGYDDYPYALQLLGPFLFPAAALGTAIGLHRRGANRWEVELAGMVGYVALGLAYLAAGGAADAGSGYGLVASVTAMAVVGAMHAAVRLVRLTSWGLSASLVGFTAFASDIAGLLSQDTAPWLVAGQFALAFAVGMLLLRRNLEVAANALRTAAILAPVACAFGLGDAGFDTFGLWHLALTAAVAATLLGAAALDLPGLMWIGAADGIFWICVVAAAAGQSAGWGLAVMLAGAGLVGLAVLIARLRPAVMPNPARL
ncbi:MAG TPA: hypothetical protein VH459_05420 [Gaiellales bacterium]